MNFLTRKGYAQIYVQHERDVQAVKDIIKELDDFEYEYLPSKMVVPFADYPNLAYTGKFDSLCMNKLTATCWSRGIHIWVCDNGNGEFIPAEGQAVVAVAEQQDPRTISPTVGRIVAVGPAVRLSDCPTGLFKFGGTFGFKTEYHENFDSGISCDAYCYPTGEYFWGGVSYHDARSKLLVIPCKIIPTS